MWLCCDAAAEYSYVVSARRVILLLMSDYFMYASELLVHVAPTYTTPTCLYFSSLAGMPSMAFVILAALLIHSFVTARTQS